MLPKQKKGLSRMAFGLQAVTLVALLLLPVKARAASKASGEGLSLAAASSLRFVMAELAAAFEKDTNIPLKTTYAASGALFAQIQAGAPYDLFFSADEAIPKRLVRDGLAEEASFFIYGTGRIALWIPKESEIDLEKDGMKSLLHASVRRIALANPRHAPYGREAVAALKKARLFQRLESELILGENLSHAAQFVRSGSAEIALLSYSFILGSPLRHKGRYWTLPGKAAPGFPQAAVILSQSRKRKLSGAFMAFFKGGRGKAILARHGLSGLE